MIIIEEERERKELNKMSIKQQLENLLLDMDDHSYGGAFKSKTFDIYIIE